MVWTERDFAQLCVRFGLWFERWLFFAFTCLRLLRAAPCRLCAAHALRARAVLFWFAVGWFCCALVGSGALVEHFWFGLVRQFPSTGAGVTNACLPRRAWPPLLTCHAPAPIPLCHTLRRLPCHACLYRLYLYWQRLPGAEKDRRVSTYLPTAFTPATTDLLHRRLLIFLPAHGSARFTFFVRFLPHLHGSPYRIILRRDIGKFLKIPENS